MTDACAHVFYRHKPWPVLDRWRCTKCGYVTRHYDHVDLMSLRPVHAHMTVACHGVNVAPRWLQRQARRQDRIEP